MKITPSTYDSLARLYAVNPIAQPVRAVAPVGAVQPVEAGSARRLPSGAERLVAARVPGGIEFKESGEAVPAAGIRTAISFYRHPADKNAAATSLQAGRVLDVTG